MRVSMARNPLKDNQIYVSSYLLKEWDNKIRGLKISQTQFFKFLWGNCCKLNILFYFG